MTTISILEAVNTTAVQFHGQPIITAMVAGVAYIAMRPIVENIGIDWTGQSVKLRNQKEKFNCRDISMVAADGKLRQLLCIPLRKLNGWLFSINPERVRADIKDKLIQYQEECFSVLHEYWTKGEVKKKSRQSSATQLTPLRQTAERLITTGLGKIYPDIWKLVHQRFDIEHIHQLQPEQVGEAIEYLNVLEGEYIGKQQELAVNNFDWGMNVHNLNAACLHLDAMYKMWRDEMEPALRLLGSPVATRFCGRISDCYAITANVKGCLERASGLKGLKPLN
ncbi:phage antirepressor N-terminal domain-containing protein [Rahnella variigena]|uniref:phage antirepressor N-terminal domain-containing protein n=1 Tax=Rahnella variigena TaxID=574964 RepID=UPI0028DC9762|nr:phage antirepressor N-terminal domain-containing protein [Rahnella variigena]